jgi:hypothetical protein
VTLPQRSTLPDDPKDAELESLAESLAEPLAESLAEPDALDESASFGKPTPRQPPPRSVRNGVFRLSALMTAVVPIVLFLVASRLEPSSRGLGTHQQLGLPPCSMRVLLGIRCPGCGMTTSWAHFTRGQWQRSWLVNSGGFLLAWFSIAVAGLALQSCFLGRLPSVSTQRTLIFVLVGIGMVTLIDWTARLAAGS